MCPGGGADAGVDCGATEPPASGGLLWAGGVRVRGSCRPLVPWLDPLVGGAGVEAVALEVAAVGGS